MPERIERTFHAFDTVNMISAFAAPDNVLDEVEALCRRYERLFSHTLPDSQLARINGAGGKPIEVDCELADLISAALDYCAATDGLFDITMGSVVQLWNFKRGIVPESDDVRNALEHVNYRRVHVNDRTVTVDDPQARIVLGGIAKGYIADAIESLLESHGVKHAMVNLGGNVFVLGGKPDGQPWRVGISQPKPSSAEGTRGAIAAVDLQSGSVVTSGVFERAFERDGVLYHHILNPRTGFPARTDLRSASVVSKRSIDGDGFSTALIIMGCEQAKSFVEARDDLEAVFVTDRGTIETTSGIGERIPFVEASDVNRS